MAKRLLACLAAAAILAASAQASAGYRSELRKATEKGSVYHATDWNAELIWHATFFSKDFRRAFEKRHEKLRYLSRPEVDRFVAEQEMRQADGWEFFIVAYTRKPYSNINNYDDSFWKFYLITESGERVKPTSVDKVQITPYEKKMFPHIDRWSRGYLVVFPKVDLGDGFKLSAESVVGRSTLDFDIR